MDNKFDESIEQLKSKYKYDIDDFSKSLKINSELNFVCYYGIEKFLRMIRELIDKLKKYNGQKKELAEKQLKSMNELLDYYKKLGNQIIIDNIYYDEIIKSIQRDCQKDSNYKNLKESNNKAIKEILDLNVYNYIKYDKAIINLIDKLRDINKTFNF